MRTASILGFVIAVLGLALMGFRHTLFATGPASITVQLGALAIIIWARITFKARSFHVSANPTAGGLVTTGPYRYWRHPIYAAGIYIAAAALGSHIDLTNAGLFLMVVVGLGIRMWAEEKLVAQMYPEYRQYAARTKRIIPYVV
jgi:protein-S-isoprenylcysteine O-methyltransferase Ste14